MCFRNYVYLNQYSGNTNAFIHVCIMYDSIQDIVCYLIYIITYKLLHNMLSLDIK